MSKKLLLSLSACALVGATAFVAYQGNIGSLRSDSLSEVGDIRTQEVRPTDPFGCALYVPYDGGYFDLQGNYISRDNEAEQDQENVFTYHTTINGEYQSVTLPLCTESDIAQIGYLDADSGRLIREDRPLETDNTVPTTSTPPTIPSTNPTLTPPTLPKPQPLTPYQIYQNAKHALEDAKARLAALSQEVPTLTARKKVLEAKTGTDSIIATQNRIAAIDREVLAQENALYKAIKFRSREEWQTAKRTQLDLHTSLSNSPDLRTLRNELTGLNTSLKTLTTDLAMRNAELKRLQSELAAIKKIKVTTANKADIALQIKNKNTDITSKTAEIKATNTSIINQKKAITTQTAKIAAKDKEIKVAADRYRTLTSYEKNIYNFDTKTSALKSERAAKDTHLTILTSELQDINTKFPELAALPLSIQTLTTAEQKAKADYEESLKNTNTGGGTGGTACELDTNPDAEACPDGTGGGGVDANTKECPDGSKVPLDQDCPNTGENISCTDAARQKAADEIDTIGKLMQDLKVLYEKLLNKSDQIEKDLDDGKITAEQAREEMAKLKPVSDRAAEINKQYTEEIERLKRIVDHCGWDGDEFIIPTMT